MFKGFGKRSHPNNLFPPVQFLSAVLPFITQNGQPCLVKAEKTFTGLSKLKGFRNLRAGKASLLYYTYQRSAILVCSRSIPIPIPIPPEGQGQYPIPIPILQSA